MVAEARRAGKLDGERTHPMPTTKTSTPPYSATSAMAAQAPRRYADVNAVVGGYLRDLAFAQSSKQKMFGYKRAAAAILALDVPLTDLLGLDRALPKIPGIGPG